MNNRMFQFRYSLERDLVEVFMKVSIGALGAPTIQRALGIKSMVRNSAGNYTITLTSSANLFMDMSSKSIVASGIPAAPVSAVVSEQVSNSASPQVIVQFSSGGVATDPASGEVLLIRLTVRNAST